MEKKTLIYVISALLIFVLGFIAIAIVVSQVKARNEEFFLPPLLDSSKCPSDFSPLPVILISLDGFKPDYLERGVTPVLNMLIERGASAPFMAATYPSITFPNHYTIVTGLYVESHGIIDNTFYDKEFNLTFSYSKGPSNQGRWWVGEPIWNTVQKHGLKSAAYYWPGSEAEIGGMRPNKFLKYDEKVPINTRIKKVIEWLSEPSSTRPSMITMYNHQPDKTGHGYGPDSNEVTEMLVEVDSTIEFLIHSLLQKDILQCVNIIIVSDHGMVMSSKDKVINLEDYIDPLVDIINFKTGIPSMMSLKENHKSEAPTLEKALSCKRKEMLLYRKDELPLRLHYSNHRRIYDYVIKTDEGFISNLNSNFTLKGLHGYDNRFKTMNSLFVAYGPSFKAGAKIEPFQNIEIYNLLCTLLNVTSAPNNGTQGLLNDILVHPSTYSELQEVMPQVLSLPDEANVNRRLKSAGYNTTKAAEIQSWSRYMNITQEKLLATSLDHLPWGAPQHSDNDLLRVKLLVNSDHVTGYSSTLKLPLWTSYSIREEPLRESSIDHWVPDIRLPGDVPTPPVLEDPFQLGQDYDIIPLFMPGFVTNGSPGTFPNLLSNAIPVTIHLKPSWESLLLDTIRRRVKYSKSPMHLVLGPAFDKDTNGLNDNTAINEKNLTVVPTHMFAIVSRCNIEVTELNMCPEDSLDALGFVFPQNMDINNCLSPEEFALEYSAKIRDIELITGFQFYPKLTEKSRLHLILRIHQELWPLKLR